MTEAQIITSNPTFYEPQETRGLVEPNLELAEKIQKAFKDSSKAMDEDNLDFKSNNHKNIQIDTPINTSLWNHAKWNGTLFAHRPDGSEPMIGFMYSNPIAGYRIFEEWIKKFGPVDQYEDIQIVILKGIDANNPFHYKVCVGANPNNLPDNTKTGSAAFILSRTNLMVPDSSVNLDRFEDCLSRNPKFKIAPVFPDDRYGFLPDNKVAIEKSEIFIEDAWRVGSDHPHAYHMSRDLVPVVPYGVKDPPFRTLSKAWEDLDNGIPYKMNRSGDA